MNLAKLNEIRDAIEFLMKSPALDKLEGKDWKVYRVGQIIRVDINDK